MTIQVINAKTRRGQNRIDKAGTNEWQVIGDNQGLDLAGLELCLIPATDTPAINESGQWFWAHATGDQDIEFVGGLNWWV